MSSCRLSPWSGPKIHQNEERAQTNRRRPNTWEPSKGCRWRGEWRCFGKTDSNLGSSHCAGGHHLRCVAWRQAEGHHRAGPGGSWHGCVWPPHLLRHCAQGRPRLPRVPAAGDRPTPPLPCSPLPANTWSEPGNLCRTRVFSSRDTLDQSRGSGTCVFRPVAVKVAVCA